MEQIYLKDLRSCYIRTFSATVLQTGSEGDNYLVLDQTAFYPHGGGQPTDTGLISWKGGSCRISAVRKKMHIMHFTPDRVPEPGTMVEAHIDWNIRYKNMRMHTAQHLVSSIIWRRFKAKTVGNQIHPGRSRIDFHPLRFTDIDISAIEHEANRSIAERHPLSVDFRERSYFMGLKDVERLDMDRLPSDVDVLRIVSIGKEGFIDTCPCAGTHVENLEDLGRIMITGVESKGKDKVRIEYILEDRSKG